MGCSSLRQRHRTVLFFRPALLHFKTRFSTFNERKFYPFQRVYDEGLKFIGSQVTNLIEKPPGLYNIYVGEDIVGYVSPELAGELELEVGTTWNKELLDITWQRWIEERAKRFSQFLLSHPRPLEELTNRVYEKFPKKFAKKALDKIITEEGLDSEKLALHFLKEYVKVKGPGGAPYLIDLLEKRGVDNFDAGGYVREFLKDRDQRADVSVAATRKWRKLPRATRYTIKQNKLLKHLRKLGFPLDLVYEFVYQQKPLPSATKDKSGATSTSSTSAANSKKKSDFDKEDFYLEVKKRTGTDYDFE